MKRTQLYLPEEDYEELRERAFRERTSVANLIREAIKEYTTHKRKKTKKKPEQKVEESPLYKIIGLYESGKKDVSEKHDEYLYRKDKD